MLSISANDEWRTIHPGAIIGLLELSGVNNAGSSASLNDLKRSTEEGLRTRFEGYSRQDFLALPVISAYERYYRQFEKTYHVQLQLESIVLKGKRLPDVSPLVDANFIAEMDTLVLTAGHDVAKLDGPVSIDVSRAGDEMTQMNGATKPIRAGDMIMRDRGGVSCSIIYGQDNRSPISAATSHVLYVAYAPAGVPEDAVRAQLSRIEENIRLFAPGAALEREELLRA